jgi:RNA polymerase-binding transcription factor DksA
MPHALATAEAAVRTQAEIDAYRQGLLALLGRLDGDRSQLAGEVTQAIGGEASGGLSDVPVHPADLGTHDFEERVTLDLLDNEEQIMEEINDALARIDQGLFGRCEACRKDIARARLRALPYARFCVACARKLERTTGP